MKPSLQGGERAGRAASLGIAAVALLVLVGGAALLGVEACAATNEARPKDAPKPVVTEPRPEPRPEPIVAPPPEPEPPPVT